MGGKPKIIIEPDQTEITLECAFDAPRRRVFEAWTKPQHIKRWYRLRDSSPPDCNVDFRVDGKWRVVLRGSQGQEHGVSGEYLEIESPQRLVQTFRYDGAPNAEAVETLNFVEKDGKTILRSTVVHKSVENRDWHVRSGMQEGAAQILGHLSDHLESSAAATPDAEDALENLDAAASKTRRIRQMAAAVLAVAVVAGGWFFWSSRQGDAAHYVSEAIGRGSVIRTVGVNGIINPVDAVQVKTNASGKVEALYCDSGAKVKAGQLCAKIDPRPYQSIIDLKKKEVADAQVLLRKDEIRLAHAKADLERNQALVKRRNIAQSAIDKWRAAYEEARARVTLHEEAITRGRASLQSAEANLAHTEIVSPIDGTVVSRNIDAGQTVATAGEEQVLFVVAPDLSAMQVDASVDAKDANEIKLGDKASFVVDVLPGRIYVGEVRQVRQSSSIGQGTSSHDIAINAPHPDLSLAPGMKATAQIVVDQRDNVLRVPNQSLRYSASRIKDAHGLETPQGEARLWLIRNGKPNTVTVQLGLDDGSYTEIVDGNLLPGDRVILNEGGARSGRP